MIYNVGYILSFDCMIIIHTILHINSPLHISLYTFHYIDTGIIHTTIKHFETIFHKLSMLYCSSWHIGPSKSTFHSLSTGLDRYCNTCTLIPTLAYCNIPYCYSLQTSSSMCVYSMFNYRVICSNFHCTSCYIQRQNTVNVW